MTKHTPGPWDWDAGDVGETYSRPYCDVYVNGGDLIIASVNDRFSKEEGHANARLIAAAPDLLAALAALLATKTDSARGWADREIKAVAQARAALKAAQPGEQT